MMFHKHTIFWFGLMALNVTALSLGAFGLKQVHTANSSAQTVPAALSETFSKAMPLVAAYSRASDIPANLIAPTQTVLQRAYVNTLNSAVSALQTPSIYGTATHSALDFHMMLAALRQAQNTPLAIDAAGAMIFLQNVHNASQTWGAQATTLMQAQWWRGSGFLSTIMGLSLLLGNALALQRRPRPYKDLTQTVAAHARGEATFDAVLQQAALLPAEAEERQALVQLLASSTNKTVGEATTPLPQANTQKPTFTNPHAPTCEGTAYAP